MLQGMVSLLSLELERRHLLGSRPPPGARRRAATDPGPRGDPGPGRRTCWPSPGCRRGPGLAVEPGAGDSAEVAADLALALPGGLVRVHEGLVEALAVEEVDAPALLAPVRPGSAGRRRARSCRVTWRRPRCARPGRPSPRAAARGGSWSRPSWPASGCCCPWPTTACSGGFADAVLLPLERPTAPVRWCRPSRPGWSWAARPRRPRNGWACTGTRCATGSTGRRR